MIVINIFTSIYQNVIIKNNLENHKNGSGLCKKEVLSSGFENIVIFCNRVLLYHYGPYQFKWELVWFWYDINVSFMCE